MTADEQIKWGGHHQVDQMAYALCDGQVVHVSQVQRGLACKCVCPTCQRPLLAKKGSIRSHHFAHATRTNCPGAAETMLHRAAKEIVATLTEIHLPAYRRCRSRRGAHWIEAAASKPILREVRESIESALVECPIASIIPDVILSIKGKRLAVEVVVTHDVDTRKLRVYRNHDIPALRISLKWQDQWLDPECLRQKLIDDLKCKNWIFHPKQRQIEAHWYRIRRHDRRLKLQQRRVAFLPEVTERLPSRAMTSAQRFDQQVQQGRVVLREQARWVRFNDWAIATMKRTGHYPSYEDYKAAGLDPMFPA
jgi:hypothetical protein